MESMRADSGDESGGMVRGTSPTYNMSTGPSRILPGMVLLNMGLRRGKTRLKTRNRGDRHNKSAQ